MVNSFPKELAKDVSVVLNTIPKRTFNDISVGVWGNSIEYQLTNETVSIPDRIYFLEPSDSEISQLTDLQKQIMYCLYTRSCDGYLREKYVRKLLDSNFKEWCIPYIVKLCDEYVIKILDAIYDSLIIRDNEDIKAFCMANKQALNKSYSRMVSYWNEYHRAENYNFDKYIGNKLFKECLGYNR